MATRRERAESWWRRQGYDRNHPVYSREQANELSHDRVNSEFDEGSDGPAGPPVDIRYTVYPTHTSNPPRPRTIAAGYDRDSRTLQIQFRSPNWKTTGRRDDGNGAVYQYFDVQPNEWKDIRRTVSTGKFLNRRLASKSYRRIRN